MIRTVPARIVAIVASFGPDETIVSATEEVIDAARRAGLETEVIRLRDVAMHACSSCRVSILQPGSLRCRCVLEDDVDAILHKLEAADGVILAAPVNTGDVSALMRTLYERMLGTIDWPDEAAAPKVRDPERSKQAVLITSSAAPSFLTCAMAQPFAMTQPLKTLRAVAELLGRRTCGTLVCGQATGGGELTERQRTRARALGQHLVRRVGDGVQPPGSGATDPWKRVGGTGR